MLSLKHWMHGRPVGLHWRSGSAFITFVVALGIGTDGLVYSLPVAVIPFQLGRLGYTELSSKTGWLLFAYAAGVIVCALLFMCPPEANLESPSSGTAPVAHFSEKYEARRVPLLVALVALQGSLIMFMLAPNYALMVLARAIQGASSAVIWTAGIALLCDVVPPERVGQQLGLAVMGLSLGTVAGPPLGGVLYQKFGFYAPFILGVALAMVDLVGRLIVIEPKVAGRWSANASDIQRAWGQGTELVTGATVCVDPPSGSASVAAVPVTLTRVKGISWHSLLQMLRSRLALTACFNTFVYGLVFGALDATLSLRLWDIFGFTSQTVGIIYIGAIVPTAFSGVITGWVSDKKGGKWITVAFELAAIPWFALLILHSSLALFVTCLALGCFFSSGIVSPVMADFAAVAREIPGIGYAHVYGIFNIAFSLAIAVGPVIGSQMYDHLADGWTGVCLFCLASMAAGGLPTVFFASNAPLAPVTMEGDEDNGRIDTE